MLYLPHGGQERESGPAGILQATELKAVSLRALRAFPAEVTTTHF